MASRVVFADLQTICTTLFKKQNCHDYVVDRVKAQRCLQPTCPLEPSGAEVLVTLRVVRRAFGAKQTHR